MRKTIFALGMIIGIGVTAPAQAIQCVPYARQVSGIELSGNAWAWWSAAEGVYQRGKSPQVGAILVFEKTRKMRYGHVAVVRQVVGKREIRIDHANWPSTGRRRGAISMDVSVIDVSKNNDWSQVRVWYEPSGTYGARVNPTYGFIYGKPGRAQPQILEASARSRGEGAASGISRPSVSVSALQAPAAAASGSAAARLNAQVLARLRGNAGASQPVVTSSAGRIIKVLARTDRKGDSPSSAD